MSNYVKSTNFASKDSLPTGDPLKIVKGTEIDSEFNNIATAVASKADSNSPSLIGTPTAPTAAAGTNNTTIATTAFVQAALQAVYPVGSVYISTVATSPATSFGFGTWVEFGAGRVLVGQNTSDSSFDVLEETGGSKDAIVVSHNHTATTSITDPGHTHLSASGTEFRQYGGTGYANGPDGLRADPQGYTSTSTTGITASTSVASIGSSGNNANLQPYVVVKMWKRTA